MLIALRIKNVAVIHEAEIPFRSGLNILSGETGAGKSIVISSISLLLGGRASAELIRAGCEEATVEGLFNIREVAFMGPRLEKLGLETGGDELLVRRVISRSGRHRVYVNGGLATLAVLQELTDGLVDLCGQHEHQSLVRPAVQLELLDRYAGLVEAARATDSDLAGFRGLIARREELRGSEAERSRKADFLRFQVEELRGAGLEAGEDGRLQDEKRHLQTSGRRLELARNVSSALAGGSEGTGAGGMLRAALADLRSLSDADGALAPLLAPLEAACLAVEETDLAVSRYAGANEDGDARLTEVQERLALIAGLRRKYGSTVAEMLESFARLSAELETLDRSEEALARIEPEIAALRAVLIEAGGKLSARRHKSAALLGDSVTGELKDLRMADARFRVEIDTQQDPEHWAATGGPDTVRFVVQTNRGEEPRALAKVASGGELSRIMLAIRRVIADKGGIGVYLFDEIDAGIGGQTAFEVGRKLKSVSKYNQVICITHLPQVASFADHHLTVRKSARGSRTATEVVPLDAPTRKDEIARMLGGPKVTPSSLKNAEELLKQAAAR